MTNEEIMRDARGRGIDWQNTSTEKKLELLYGWCANLEGRLNGQAQAFAAMSNRVAKAEEKFSGSNAK
jgi:hypothetical protein